MDILPAGDDRPVSAQLRRVTILGQGEAKSDKPK